MPFVIERTIFSIVNLPSFSKQKQKKNFKKRIMQFGIVCSLFLPLKWNSNVKCMKSYVMLYPLHFHVNGSLISFPSIHKNENIIKFCMHK